MSRSQAQATALRELKSLRYGEGDYFWVNTYDARMVMHPTKPELDGTDVSGMKDPDGVAIFNRFIEVIQRQGAGAVAYQWPKPGAEDPQPKISYVVGYEPWQWIVGSGVYADDIEVAVSGDLRRLGVGVAGIVAVLMGVSWAIRRSITRPVVAMTQLLERGALDQRLDEAGGHTTSSSRPAGPPNKLARRRRPPRP